MRRLLFLFASVCVLTMLAGCNLFHWHGVCDCEVDDYCSSRSPWVRYQHGAAAPAPVEYMAPAPGKTETIPAPIPAKLPDSKLPDTKKPNL